MPTGIQGLDPLIEGGLLRGDFVLLLGGMGTGKTIFSSQFVYNAALKLNEPAVFATFRGGYQEPKAQHAEFWNGFVGARSSEETETYRLGCAGGAEDSARTFRFCSKRWMKSKEEDWSLTPLLPSWPEQERNLIILS